MSDFYLEFDKELSFFVNSEIFETRLQGHFVSFLKLTDQALCTETHTAALRSPLAMAMTTVV